MRPLALIFLMLSLAVGARVAVAQERAEEPGKIKSLAGETAAAFDRRDFARAEELLRKHIAVEPGNFVLYYNLACARAMRGDPKDAAEWLERAVEHGFSDLVHMERDAMLDSVRPEPAYRRMVENWSVILEARRDANLKAVEAKYSKGYTTTTDDALRLNYRSAFEATTFEKAKAELVAIAKWCDTSIIPGILDDDQRDAWVTVILPTRDDYVDWIVDRYGTDATGGVSMVGGAYLHDDKMLIAMDLGATLRHEFLHILHWRSMTRLSQRHPIWIMEGLCSLPEDIDIDAEGNARPAISWRTNMAKRMAKAGAIRKIEEFAGMPHHRFTGTRPLANYAQARAIFLMLERKGLLKAWYESYTGTFREDESGLQALLAVTQTDAKSFDRMFKQWLNELPAVAEEIKPGMASLGVEINPGEGDGVEITTVTRPRRELGELRIGDVMTALNGKPVRDVAELVRVLSTMAPGETVTVSYRRGKKTGETSIVLIAKEKERR
jgi:hypothetical protein